MGGDKGQDYKGIRERNIENPNFQIQSSNQIQNPKPKIWILNFELDLNLELWT